jgi:hypothetical protein
MDELKVSMSDAAIRSMVDAETAACNARDADAPVSLLHADDLGDAIRSI